MATSYHWNLKIKSSRGHKRFQLKYQKKNCRREDWRDKPVFTIDPTSAKDFDDAILVEKLDNQMWRLAVHIADVYYVKSGSN